MQKLDTYKNNCADKGKSFVSSSILIHVNQTFTKYSKNTLAAV